MPPLPREPRRKKRGPGRPRDPELARRRREEILGEAAKIFAARGFPSTDLEVVARALGVGKGTIYRYFPSKRALFLAAVDQGLRRLSERVEGAVATVTDPLDLLAAAARAYLGFFDENPELVELFVQERAEFKDRKTPSYVEHRERSLEPWRAVFRGLLEEGRVRPIEPERVLDLSSDLLYGMIFTGYFGGEGRPRSFAAQADAILDLLFFGVLSESERAARLRAAR